MADIISELLSIEEFGELIMELNDGQMIKINNKMTKENLMRFRYNQLYQICKQLRKISGDNFVDESFAKLYGL